MNKPAELPTPAKNNDNPQQHTPADPAVNVIRNKINRLYSKEPNARNEEKEIEKGGVHSKHQAFMQQLMESGANQKQIQQAWHKYYLSLPDNEKHQVWREFYENQNKLSKEKLSAKPLVINPQPKNIPQLPHRMRYKPIAESIPTEAAEDATKTRGIVKKKASKRGKLSAKHHLQSLAFGVGMGLVVILIFMFGFFNERFIVPFITPSKTASSSPIILDPNATGQVGPEPKLIIPKLNVEVPVVYNVPSNNEKDIQKGLEDGVVHYPTTPYPGQKGNVGIVGHSSNNIFNPGKYKYVFTLLNKLQEGDIFIMNYNGQRFVYKIYKRQVVKPSDVWVLQTQEKPSTATLITCDPPGTNVNRLVLVGEQISPEPLKNVASTASQSVSQPSSVPGNSPSLFDRLFGR
jgi:LPXTG-site transpeptidase (sortase) family protein